MITKDRCPKCGMGLTLTGMCLRCRGESHPTVPATEGATCPTCGRDVATNRNEGCDMRFCSDPANCRPVTPAAPDINDPETWRGIGDTYDAAPTPPADAEEIARKIVLGLDELCDKHHVSVAPDIRGYLQTAAVAAITEYAKPLLERIGELERELANRAHTQSEYVNLYQAAEARVDSLSATLERVRETLEKWAAGYLPPTQGDIDELVASLAPAATTEESCLCKFAIPDWDGKTHDRRCRLAAMEAPE